MSRSSGVLMHVASLPGSHSIGCFGREARDFIDLLVDSGFTWWQVLPFTMADDCNSPYKSYSAFGGNPYLVDLSILAAEGYLTAEELAAAEQETPYACEFGRLAETRLPLLRLAASRATAEDIDGYLSAPTDSQQLIIQSLKEVVVEASWKMVYSKDDTEFEKLWDQMVKDCNELGAKDILEWRIQDIENAKKLLAEQK